MARDTHPTRTQSPDLATGSFDALDAGLAAAFGADLTPGGWSQPPLLRDDPSDGSPLVQPSSPEMPRGSDDRYQLLGEIARGGMGVVLKGRDPDLGRDLAFKVLRAELARRPGAVQRFVEEAQVGGQLQHPGVVPVYDLGRFADGRPYFAMKLVKGRTLADLLAERSSPSTDRGVFLQHFLQVCQTIAYAHSKGVIHRDLKPSNVMVGGFGEVLVMDWGLAKVLPKGGVADELKASRVRSQPKEEGPTEIKTARFGSGGSDTQAGSVMGTPAFMPPEQAGGEIDKLDERADVFGLGAVLCVILTGQPPYKADTPDAIRLMAVRGDLEGAFMRLDECGSDADLVTLCKRCLSSKHEARPRHAGEVAAELGAYLAGVEQRAHDADMERAAAEVRANEQRKRRRVQAALGLAFTAILGLGGAFAWWTQDQKRIRNARIDLALKEVEVLSDQAAHDENQSVRRWRDAGDSLAKVEGILNQDASPAARERLDSLRDAIAAGLKEAETNQTLIEQIDRIRYEGEGKEADQALAAAFKAAGLDADALTEEEFAKRLETRPAAVRTIVPPTLDFWAMSRRGDLVNYDSRIEKGVKRLFSLARRVDPDDWRNRLRTALEGRDLITLHALGAEKEKLSKQGPAHLWLLGLGHALCGDNKCAVEVLRPAAHKYPEDYTLALELAFAIEDASRTGINASFAVATSANAEVYRKAEPYVRAAVALRSKSARPRKVLAISLMYQERYAEAQKEMLTAIELAPKDSQPLCIYADFLQKIRPENESAYLEQYRKALAVNPAESHALPFAGKVVLDRGGSSKDVLDLYRAAAAHDPRKGSSLLANKLWDFGLYEEAEAMLRKVIASDPDWRMHRYDLAHLFLHGQGESSKGIAVLREALAADPEDPQYNAWLGWALEQTGDYAGSLEVFKKAKLLDPGDFHVHFGIALNYLNLNRPEEAIQPLRDAIACHPRFVDAHRTLIAAMVRSKKGDQGIQEYAAMVARESGDPFPHWLLGLVHDQMRNTDAATKEYLEALKLDPKYENARMNYMSLLLRSKNYDQVIQYCQDGLARDPKDILLGQGLVAALVQTQKQDEAVELAKKIFREHPKDHAAQHGLSNILTRARRWGEAAEALNVHIRVEPGTAVLHFQLGVLREKLGDLEAAEKAYRTAGALAPTRDVYQFHLALLLEKRKKPQEATDILNRLASNEKSSGAGLLSGTAFRLVKDTAGYERARKLLLDRYRETKDVGAMVDTVKLWLLDPNVSDELQALTALAERSASAEGQKSSYFEQYPNHVKVACGLAALRNNHWSEAIKCCDGLVVYAGDGTGPMKQAARAIKAMALHGQRGPEWQLAAGQELSEAESLLNEKLADPHSATSYQTNDYLFARILVDEARARTGIPYVEPAPAPREVKR